MAFEFKFPDVGEGIHEGEIVRWRVKVGDEVKEDQPVIEVETAKAIVELPSPKTGTVLATIGKEGDKINVGAILVVIGEKGETWTPGETSKEAQPKAETTSKAGPGVVGEIPTDAGGVVLPSRKPETGASTTAHAGPILPRLRKLAQDMGVDMSKLKGTGPGGQITEQDIKSASAGPKISVPAPDISGAVERVPLKGIRKAIAAHMSLSAATIPHVTHMDEFDASALVKARSNKKAEAEKKGIKLTYLAYIIKATAEVLKKYPALNASLDETSQEIIYKKYYNIGFAVDTDDGLMVPVIKDVDTKDLFTIAQEIVKLAEACKSRTISPDAFKGASFTVTNIGSTGGIYATPIIPLGQSAILGVMRLQEKPVAREGKVEVRPVQSFALSFDHRILDGAMAARFMNDIGAALLSL